MLHRDPICKLCNRAPLTDADHILPRSRGGEDTLENLQGLCHTCHSRKTVREDGGWGRVARALGLGILALTSVLGCSAAPAADQQEPIGVLRMILDYGEKGRFVQDNPGTDGTGRPKQVIFIWRPADTTPGVPAYKTVYTLSRELPLRAGVE